MNMAGEKLIWKTKEFRDAKEKFIKEGKLKDKCEWCKSKKFLTPHHKTSLRVLFYHHFRKTLIEKMSKEMGFTFTSSAIYKSGGFGIKLGKENRYIKSKEFKPFIEKHPEIKSGASEKAKKEYLQFKDIQTLCKRCHFATENNMELCPYCKKNYYKIGKYNFEYYCSDCSEKAEKEAESWETE
jgi:hypothetical protein